MSAPQPPPTQVRDFGVITANIAFGTSDNNPARNQRDAFANRARAYLNGLDPTTLATPYNIISQPAGKYADGPGLAITARLKTRADTDAMWADLEAQAFNTITGGTIQQAEVIDSEVTQIHRRSFPPDPSDF